MGIEGKERGERKEINKWIKKEMEKKIDEEETRRGCAIPGAVILAILDCPGKIPLLDFPNREENRVVELFS